MDSKFFVSQKHPHLWMNRFSVVFAPNGHPDGRDFYGKSFEYVPLRQGTLDLRYEVEHEAYEAGYRYRIEQGEKVWTKPVRQAVTA